MSYYLKEEAYRLIKSFLVKYMIDESGTVIYNDELISAISENLGLSKKSVGEYIRRMAADGVIQRVRRGVYKVDAGRAAVRYVSNKEYEFLVMFGIRCLCCSPEDDRIAKVTPQTFADVADFLDMEESDVREHFEDMVCDGDISLVGDQVYMLSKKTDSDPDRYTYIMWKRACEQWDNTDPNGPTPHKMPIFEEWGGSFV